MDLATYYHTDKLKGQASVWSRVRAAADVLVATYQGRWVAVTITIQRSAWICHPMRTGDLWAKRRSKTQCTHPPRHIRKAAKMALRSFLNP